jgi:hypothetical protein
VSVCKSLRLLWIGVALIEWVDEAVVGDRTVFEALFEDAGVGIAAAFFDDEYREWKAEE